ncbi:DoxX family protein [Hymenobacter sp. HMF4947]|uniref:DoxX family protein n=1 Tax=Hymenobacter ginkgonis TaxID=2682976 RepID=A0A7K1TCT1_9BACT|nr:BT_3928 family protein [Hymenobacter ginkgonis]MVN76200.1 DoxX family protein [Hymenobacter ginkgonis]
MPTPSAAPVPAAPHLLRLLTRVCWLLLGLLFIFSGLVKLNDPVGTAYKLEEYFEVFATDVPFMSWLFEPLHNASRFLSVALSSLEVIVGAALLLRWYLRQTLLTLLGLLVFFGFLTFYSAAFNKVTDCGCFGDFIKLTPWTSFAKDLFLLVLWGVVFRGQRFLRHSFVRGTPGLMAMTFVGALAIGIGVRALGHLPYFDFLPYKVGNNIPQLMKPAEPPRYQYTFVRNGQTMQAEQFPTDTTWKYQSMAVLNPEKSKPLITDFVITDGEGNDVTKQVLTGKKLLLIVQNTNKTDRDRFEQLNKLFAEAAQSRKKIEVLTITSTSAGKFDSFRHDVNLATPFYFADATVLKSVIRSNPGLLLLNNGTVMAKYHYHDIPALYQVEKALQ